jgi:hypothetical protein
VVALMVHLGIREISTTMKLEAENKPDVERDELSELEREVTWWVHAYYYLMPAKHDPWRISRERFDHRQGFKCLDE